MADFIRRARETLTGGRPASTAGEGRASRTSFAEFAGIWGVFVATPTGFIGILDVPATQKVVWSVIFLVEATALLFLLGRLFGWIGGSPVRLRHSLLILPLVMVIAIGFGVFAGTTWQRSVRQRDADCVPVGSGNAEYEGAFVEAYRRHGGATALGCPIGPIQAAGGAFHENLRSPKGSSAIFAGKPDHAFVLTGPPYAAYLAIGSGDGVQSTQIAGVPSSEARAIDHGAMIELTDARRQHSALLGRPGKDWFWVPQQIWWRYEQLGGPAGSLGFPIGAVESWQDGSRQRFEKSWLWYHFSRGTVTESEYAHGESKPQSKPVPVTQQVVYDVGNESSTPHEIPFQGRVRQQFRATTPYIREIGVIIGLNPDQMTQPNHQALIELVNGADGVLHSEIVDIISDRLSNRAFTPVAVHVGNLYAIRVTNLSGDIIGVRLGSPTAPADMSQRAWLEREVPKPDGHFDEDGVLCGRILGSIG
jgi:hypothetical protein